MREAKASYLDALSGLRAAEAEVQKSLAAINNGKAEWEKANAAYRQAEAKAKEIENETEKAKADTLIAGAKKQAEIAAINYQKAMAEAQKALEETQKRIAAAALSLTQDEQGAITGAISTLKDALSKYNTAVGNVETAKGALLTAQYGFVDNKHVNQEDYVASLNDTIAAKKAIIAENQAWKEKVNTDPNVEAWQAYVDGLKAEAQKAAFDTNTMRANEIILSSTTLKDAKTAAENAWAEWKKANEVKQTEPEKVTYKPEMPEIQGNSLWFANLMETWVKDALGYDGEWKWQLDGSTTEYVSKVLDGWDEEKYPSANKIQKLGFKGVIKTIEDSKILEPDTTTVEGLEKAYNVADSTYKADLNTLKKGFAAYLAADTNYTKAVADTSVKLEAYMADTAAYHVKQADSLAKYDADTAAVKALIKSRDELSNAFKALNSNIDTNPVGECYDQKYMDTLAAAIADFATKKEAVFGVQAADYIHYQKASFDGNGELKSVAWDSLAVKNLAVEDFGQAIDSIKVTYNAGTSQNTINFKIRNQFCLDSTSVTMEGYVGKITRYFYKSFESPYTYTIPAELSNISYETVGGYVVPEAVDNEIKSIFNANPNIKDNAKRSLPYYSNADLKNTALYKALDALGLNLTEYTKELTNDPANNPDKWFAFAVVDEKGEEYTVGLTEAGLTPAYVAQYPFGLWDINTGAKSAFIPAASKAAFAAAEAAYTKVYGAKGSKKAYETAKEKVNEIILASYNDFRKVKYDFYGTANYADLDATWYKNKFDLEAIDAEVKANIEKFEYCVSKLDPYVEYDINGSVIVDGELKIVDDLVAYGRFADVAKLVEFISNGNNTEYANAKKAEFEYKITAEQKDAVEYLAAVKAWVEGLEAELAKVVAANEEANAAYYAYQEKAFGIDEDRSAETKKTEYYKEYFKKVNNAYDYNVNEAPAAGQQKAIYDQYLAEVVGKIAKLNADIETLDTRVKSIDALVKSANEAAIKAVAVANLKDANALNDANKDFAKAVENLIAIIDGNITAAEKRIADCEWELAQIAAGVDNKVIAVTSAERALAEAEQALADAEAVLKVAQAQYDAVMAKYVK